ncbi:hypothetical protein QPL79_06790 [Ignisphaera sp. 4213-co]|uniref:30S ribosomal protein S25e n=1 Tax=Ignisphaera cupida TaxID=3050454 RepID=A0ABD4Z6W1_9CREN|nr:hypothetical protein [Ignisphaera sp. 4213-co]MDK6029066.1 hypothetical protein [Ignisphaera sp. 4213-co]
MGTKGGKPLSTLEKRQKRMVKKEEVKKVVKEEKKAAPAISVVDEGLASKVLEEVNNTGYATTFTISQKLGIKYGLAKKMLLHLIKQGSVKLGVKSRRIILVTKK